jgi:CheY-like chemotaxis protein
MPAAPAKILVINDDRPFLDLMEELLEDTEGYAVETRKEWEGAYEFVKEHRPDLVILDIRIGGEERGWQILQMLTLDPATLPIPVIVCSAAIDDLQEHQPLLDKYGVRVLPKPFDLDDLLAIVSTCLASGARAVAQ